MEDPSVAGYLALGREVLTNAHGCLPVLDDDGNAAGDRGTEFLPCEGQRCG